MHSFSNPVSDWLVPDWPAPPGVRAICTTRNGGYSTPPYDSLNLGSHVGDEEASVARNRRVLQVAVGAQPVFMNQVHGTDVVVLDAQSPECPVADGAVTTSRGPACTVMVADCLAVLVCDRGGTTVAAAHAGWRGLAGSNGNGILEEVCKQFMVLSRVSHESIATELIAWLGPCIGPSAFEVGPDVRDAFVGHNPTAAQCFQPTARDRWLADLPGLARQRLYALGITQVFGNDGTAPWCTATNSLRFFSHRRDRISGRQGACIWLA
jgi:YfiH family protein